MKKKEKGRSINWSARPLRCILICVFSVYLITVLWYTVGKRETGYHQGQFELFWSYKLWFEGQTEYGYPILANIAMFVPFGFLTAALRNGSWKKTVVLLFLLSLAFSCLIEALQYIMMRGCFEYDDMINNVVGALLGAVLFCLLRSFLPANLLRGLLAAAGVGIFLICLGVFLQVGGKKSGAVKTISQGLCFQIESAAVADGRLEVTGVCFWYDQGPAEYSIVLQSARTGKKYPLKTECGLPRSDVSAYFHMEGIQPGFAAYGEGFRDDEEYEIFLDFGFLRSVSSNVYLSINKSEPDCEPRRADVRFVPSSTFQPLEADGTDMEELTRNGVLLACNPMHHVYVYYSNGSLYWIADQGYYFEDDGSTRLELYLWTTEKDKLSEKSRESGMSYDTFGVYFEKNELKGSFGKYRVCAKELPTRYPITSIRTGYYSKGWIWQENFWPVFDFSQ